MKKFINTLIASRRYGKACRRLKQGKYNEAMEYIRSALELGAEEYMLFLHRALKGEIEYELGEYEESKITIGNLLNDMKKDPELWENPRCKDVVNRVNWFWNELQNKAT